MNPQEQVTPANRLFSARIFLVAGSLFFVAAICLHHNFNPATLVRDVVIYPVALLVPAALWNNRRWLYVAAAVVIAIPSLGFVNVSALGKPVEFKPFLNNLFLLLGGASAILTGITAFVRKQA
jgi:hypothetical protein